jgi:MoaE-MoaD fusion protein
MTKEASIQLFARLRELNGSPSVVVLLADGSKVSDLRENLESQLQGEMRSLARKSAVAVNGEYATDDQILKAADDIALIPPVSGG